MDLGQVLPNPLQRLVLPPRPVVLSGSVIQSNNALGINQDPFPVREPACAGIDRSGGLTAPGQPFCRGVCVCAPGGAGVPPARTKLPRNNRPQKRALPITNRTPFSPPPRFNLLRARGEIYRCLNKSTVFWLKPLAKRHSQIQVPSGEAAAAFCSKSARYFGFQRMASSSPAATPLRSAVRGRVRRTRKGKAGRALAVEGAGGGEVCGGAAYDRLIKEIMLVPEPHGCSPRPVLRPTTEPGLVGEGAAAARAKRPEKASEKRLRAAAGQE